MTAYSKVKQARVGVLLAAAVVLALTACGPLKAGSAATVGDEALTEASVKATAEEVDAVLADADLELAYPADQVNLAIVARWVDAQLVSILAQQEGVEVTDTDVARLLESYDDEARLQLTASDAILPSQLEAEARSFLLKQELAQALDPTGTAEEQAQALYDALAVAAEDVGVSVNPRFGTWDPDIPGVGPRDDARLSSPEPGSEPSEPPVPAVP